MFKINFLFVVKNDKKSVVFGKIKRTRGEVCSGLLEYLPFKYEAQTALVKDPVRTAQ